MPGRTTTWPNPSSVARWFWRSNGFLRARALEDENRRLAAALDERDRLVDLVGSAPSMQRLFRRVEKLAGTDATVLLTGESGTGKELAARALHSLSRRSDGPFIPVNCAAIPEGLVESEFFGVEKGAFTGADRARAGSFEAARGGTLFLDEVGELPIAVQPKLLRALQEGRFSRVGSNREIQADARIIAATNRDLAAEVQQGGFREDLYYRLNVVPLRMPPLRERREDIPRLVEHFIQRAARRHDLPVSGVPRRVLKRLMDYPWPGNVRELGNAVERLVLLAEDGNVTVDDLPESMQAEATGHSTFRLPPSGLSWDAPRTGLLAASARAHEWQPCPCRAPARSTVQGVPVPARQARDRRVLISAGISPNQDVFERRTAQKQVISRLLLRKLTWHGSCSNHPRRVFETKQDIHSIRGDPP